LQAAKEKSSQSVNLALGCIIAALPAAQWKGPQGRPENGV